MKYTVKENHYIIENYLRLSDKEIAKRLKRTELGIKVHRKRLGFSRENKTGLDRFNRTNSLNAEVIALINIIDDGLFVDIATARLNEINSELDIEPIVMMRRNKVPRKIKAKAYELFRKGLTTVEIADKFSVSRQSVWRWIEDIKGYFGDNAITITLQSKINDKGP